MLFRRFAESYRFPEGKRSLAALKRGLFRRGVLTSDAVAKGTPALSNQQASILDAELERLGDAIAAELPSRWVSDPAEAEEP